MCAPTEGEHTAEKKGPVGDAPRDIVVIPLAATAAVILSLVAFSEPLAVASGLLPAAFADGSMFSQAFAVRENAAHTPRFGFYLAPLAALGSYEMLRCCLAHLGARLALEAVARAVRTNSKDEPVIADPAARAVLARSAMNVCFLGACGYRGVQMWRDLVSSTKALPSVAQLAQALSAKGMESGATTSRSRRLAPAASLNGLPYVPGTPQQRLYAHRDDFQRLAGVMAAFQLKNLADTVAYDDGAVFFVHHLLTVAVAVSALRSFAHFHGTFFFGVSELSTTVLAVLVNFDKDHGVPALERRYPTTRKLVGGVFAVSFVVIRAILWPFFTFFFISDSLAVLRDGLAHDTYVVWFFVVSLAVLSAMQLLWLGQIALTVHREVIQPFLSPSSKQD